MRERRKELNLTQVDAAKKAGMAVGQWNDMESGRRPNITIAMLNTIAAALELDDARELLTPAKVKRRSK